MNFKKKIIIDGKEISNDSPTYIIAEAGVNHNGDLDNALRLVDCAVEAGVDAIKFQMFKTEDLILKNVKKAQYQERETGTEKNQYAMLKELEMVSSDFRKIIEYCQKANITFLCTPFEEHSLNILDSFSVPAYKVAATDLTNVQFLRQIANKHKPMIVSAGMCYLEEVRIALESIYPLNQEVILLQCTANYPLSDEEVNLNVINAFKREFDILVGYSDHSVGVGAAPYSVAMGAAVVEKHITLDKNMVGPDHKASITPNELKQLVSDIRRVETYLGSEKKIPTISELQNRRSLQKNIVAAETIHKGETFTTHNIVAKRTDGVGIPALYFDQLLGTQAKRDYTVDEVI